MIGKLTYTCIECKDLEQQVIWYEEKLGLKPINKGQGWATFDGGSHAILLWSGTEPGMIFGFDGAELELAHSKLTKRGLKPTEIESHPGGSHFYVRDPEGNRIMISDK